MTAQVKPLGQLQVTKQSSVSRPQATSTANKEPASQAGSIVPHSAAQQARSTTYHKTTVDRPHTRGIDALNPTQVVPAHRSFPGLAN